MSSRFSFHLLLWSCLLILLGVMGWLSHSMLDAERRRLEETHQIRLVEQSRLALWRMDSLLASMIAGENNRSPGEYFPGNVLADSFREKNSMPDLSGFAKLYFQIDPRGNISSPQKGTERMEHVLQLEKSGWGNRVMDAMKNLPEPSSISREEAVPQESYSFSVPPVEEAVQAASVTIVEGRGQQRNGLPLELAVVQQGMEDYNMRKNLSNSQQEYNINIKVKKKASETPRGGITEARVAGRKAIARGMDKRSAPEQEKGQDGASPLKTWEKGAGDKMILLDADKGELVMGGEEVQVEIDEKKEKPVKEKVLETHANRREELAKTPESYRELSISSFQPRWHQEKECFLTRRISDHGQIWVQGIWLDWDKLSSCLLASVADILPEATLSPADGQADSYLTLAGIPAMLNPGNLPSLPANSLRTVWNSMAMA